MFTTRRILPSALACAMLTMFTNSASAADAIEFQAWGGGAGATPDIGIGDSLSVTKNLSKSNYSGNAALLYSAWAHAGGTPWYTFHLTETADVLMSLAPGAGASATYMPGMTVWASGANIFDGGTGGGTEASNNGWNAPHSFNAVGQIGDAGTLWASGANGNQLETLAYAMTGASHLSTDAGGTGWDENYVTGFHDVSISNTYEHGITGTAAAGAQSLSMAFNDMQAGWYTVFIGGTNHASASSDYVLSVSAVPEPETYAMFLAGLGLMGLVARRRQQSGRVVG
jgi:hypothetical protein